MRALLRSVLIATHVLACAGAARIDSGQPTTDEGAYTSAQSTLLSFAFDASFVTKTTPWSPRQLVQQQLLYTIGQLNGHDAVGRLDAAVLSNITTTQQPNGTYLTRYHAALPVSWGAKSDFPTAFVFKLPKDSDGYEAFTAKYKDTCTESGAHAVDSGSMWYYYRPDDCVVGAADVVSASASISVSAENTTGKYPEYDKVWQDGTFNVVGIFGKFENGATENDAGIDAFNTFIEQTKLQLGSGVSVVTLQNDVTMSVTRGDGRRIVVTALQIDNPVLAGADFNTRYNALSGRADLITYNGHAGLGSNVRALADKGVHLKGQYQIVFMNGCDTFAYVDGALAQKKAAVNPDDPKGTKYLDMVTNGMPAFFQSMPYAMLALVSALSNPAAPKTYEQIFAGVDESQFVVATGEEDNTYTP